MCQSLVRPEGSCESYFFFGGAGGGGGGTGKITPAKEILLLLGSVELSGLLAGAEVARKGTCAKLCFLSTPYWRRDGKAGRAEDGETQKLDRVRAKDQHLTELPSKALIHQILQPGTGKRAQLLLRTLS